MDPGVLAFLAGMGRLSPYRQEFQKSFRHPSGLGDKTSGTLGSSPRKSPDKLSFGETPRRRRADMTGTKANLLLLVAAALWGVGNIAQKAVLEHLDPFSAVSLRCLIAGLLILPLLRFDRGGWEAHGFWVSAVRVAAFLAIALSLQQAAYLSTSVMNAGFLVNTATVITPILAWVYLRERTTLRVWGAAGVTMVGIYMLCGGLRGFGQGDLVSLNSALFYAAWMIELGRHMQTFGNPVRTACTQFLVTAALTLPIGAVWGSLSVSAALAAAPELFVLGAGSTALAFGFQTIALRYTPASHAAVIVSAEGVFGAIAAALFLGERISVTAYFGAALMLAAIVNLAFGGTQTGKALRPVAHG
jgi:drug/metabolite transporter (DMT)-like permease